MKKTGLGLLLSFLLLGTGTLAWADPPLWMMEGNSHSYGTSHDVMMDGGMKSYSMGMGYPRGMHEMDYDQLDLTLAQKEKIYAIKKMSKSTYGNLRQEISQKYRELHQLKRAANADLGEINKKIDEISDLYNKMTAQMAEDHEKILAILTPEQKKQIPYLKSKFLKRFYGLELTSTQKAAIVGLEEKSRSKIQDLREKIRNQTRDYHNNIYGTDFNKSAAIKAGQEIAKTVADLEKVEADLYINALKVLTPEQQAKYESMHQDGVMMRGHDKRMDRDRMMDKDHMIDRDD